MVSYLLHLLDLDLLGTKEINFNASGLVDSSLIVCDCACLLDRMALVLVFLFSWTYMSPCIS